MQKVVCIDESCQPLEVDGVARVKKGNVYTVVETIFSKEERKDNIRYIGGTYYILAECGNLVGYHDSMFIEINEIQQDETEFERNYKTEKV